MRKPVERTPTKWDIMDNTGKKPRNIRTPATEIRGIILDTARRIIEGEGYDALTIRLLSERSRVAPASIYRHVGGKQDVVDALIDDSFMSLREALLGVTTRDPLKRLYDAGIVYREHAQASPGVYALLWRRHVGASANACLAVMTELVRYGQAAGRIRDDDPGLIAWSIWSSVHGFIQFELCHDHNPHADQTGDDSAYSFLLELLIRGIMSSPEADAADMTAEADAH